MSTTTTTTKTALVTGANSGLGYEAAAQLAEAGYGRVILACRSEAKAEGAKQTLTARVGRDAFDTLVIDVADIASSRRAAAELIERGDHIDALLLNAGLVAGEQMHKSVDGFEMTFAASIIGHHVLTMALLEAGLLDGSRVALVGSEAANDDLPAMMGMSPFDFATGTSSVFGDDLHDAMLTFARGDAPELYDNNRYYSTTKVFSAWWSAALARRTDGKLQVFTVSPGANMGTNASRHATGFKRFLYTKVMPALGPILGWDQPVPKGAKRYVDVLEGIGGPYTNGRTYTSAPRKMVGPLHEVTYPHILDDRKGEVAWSVLEELVAEA
jgi:NAD(P)-dependent dehydrogenase (short-subunit alcohol dehydrogenase family)